MPKPFAKTAANIAPPPDSSDVSSAMQTSGAQVLGLLTETAGVDAPGANIGSAIVTDHAISIA